MTDAEIIKYLKAGEVLTFGVHGHNEEVMAFMARLEKEGKIETWDASLSQETRRSARWVEV
jgi:hypothetical protein